MKNQFELKADGTVERVGNFGAYGPTIYAKTKTEALAKVAAFAYRALNNSPTVKVRNGAYQLTYAALEGFAVESGTDERKLPICLSSVKDIRDLDDETASFSYYASSTYRDNMRATETFNDSGERARVLA